MENDNIEIGIQADVQVNDKGVDKAAEGMTKIATNAEGAEKQVKELNTAISQAGTLLSQLNKTIKPGMDLSEVEKALSSIEKRVDTAINNSINMYAQNVLKEISGQHKLRTGLLYDAQGLRNDRDRSVESHLNNMYSDNARQRYYQLSHLNRYTDWKENRRDTDPNWQKYLFNQSVQERIEKGYKEKHIFDENSVRYAEKDLDLWAKRLNEEVGVALKRNLESSKKAVDKLYQEKMLEPRKKYYQQQHDERFKNRYYEEQHNQRYERWQNSPLSENEAMRLLMTGKFDADSLIRRTETWNSGETEAVLEKIDQALKEREEIEKQKTEEAKKQLSDEQKITDAKEQEVQVSQKSADKQKPMSEFQAKKTEIAEKKLSLEEQELALAKEKFEEQQKENARKKERQNSNYEKFKNEHPELFAQRGGQYFNKKYQAANVLSAIGGRLSGLGTGGKIVGDILETIGSFARSPIAGAATAVTKLVTGIIDLGEAAVKSFSEIESIKTQLGVVFSNQTQAEGMFGQISQYATHSPFGVQQTSELAVLLKQSGVYASDLMDTLKMLGDTAGGNMEKMKRIANNYAQIVSIGKASMLDMRQFAYAGIPIFEAVSKELGVSQKELRKMISDGKVTSDIIAKVFKDLTGINGIFENATEKGAKTVKARLQNLQDAKQLAYAERGERFANAGSKYGNDSPYMRFITEAENYFSWVQKQNHITNIEREVKVIARGRTKLQELEEVKKYAEEIGDKNLKKLVEEQIKAQMSVTGYEKSRQVLASSYDVKNEGWKKYAEQYGELTVKGIEDLIDHYQDIISSDRYLPLNESVNGSLLSSDITQAEREALQREVEMINSILRDLELYRVELIKAKKITTEDEIKAERERRLETEQQEKFDEANKLSDSSSSLMATFQELNEAYKASDKYKERQEKEKNETLKEGLKLLKKIANKYADKQGNVNFLSMSPKEFNELYNKGAFDAIHELQVVNKDRKYSAEERNTLVSQYGGTQTKLENFLLGYVQTLGREYINDNFHIQNLGLTGGMSDRDFYDFFSDFYYSNKDNIEDVKKRYASARRKEAEQAASVAPETAKESLLAFAESDIKRFYAEIEEYSTALGRSINTYSTMVEGSELDESEIGKGKVDFIPLWKRVMAQYTGLSTLEMTDPTTTMDKYRTDMAVRNMASNVMSAAMQSMGLGAGTKLIAPGIAKQLKEDSRATLQVDWAKTRENIKNFSTELSASTDVVSAYKQSLEEELDTYRQLIIAGYTQGEDQNGGESQFISVKKLAQYAQSNEQLVNAFGDSIRTVSGQIYNLEDITITKEGLMFDKFGKQIEDQVEMTSELSRYVEKILPEIAKDIHEATVAEVKNSVLNQMLGDVIGTQFASKLLGTGLTGKAANFVVNNQEQVSTLATSAINTLKIGSPIENLSPEDIFLYANRAKTGELDKLIKEAELLDARSEEFKKSAELIIKLDKSLKVYNEAIELTGTYITDLANDNGFGLLNSLGQTKTRDEALNNLWLKMNGGYNGQLTPSAWKDEGGYDLKSKIVKDTLGYSRDFTKEDYYNDFKEKFGISGELEKGTKKFLDMQLAIQDTRDVMKSLGDETANLVGTLGKKALTIPFEKLGESAMNYWSEALSYEEASEKCAEDQKQAYKELGTEALQALGPIMQKAGFEMVARGAIDGSKTMILGGLGLAAVGGFASGLGNALSANNDNDKDEVEKIQDLKDQLADLLEQARKDALYYENNLRHKTALGINKEFSYQSVNDAVITPDGDVITTDPEDYLIATKTPGQFAGGGAVTPIINNNIINNSSSKVRQEQQQNPDGSIDIITIIEDTVGNYIASSKSDDAFSARNSRIRGRQSIMS